MAGVAHHLPLIHCWDMSLPLFSTRTATVTDVQGHNPASRRIHGNLEPGLLCLLPLESPVASTSASSHSSV